MHVCVVRALCMELNQFMQLGLMTFFSLLLSLTVFCILSLPLPLFVRSSFGRSLHLFVIEDCWEEIASCCSIPFLNLYIHIILGNTSIYLSFIYILLLGMTGWAISVLDCPPEVSPSLLLLSFRSFFLPSSDWGKHVKLAIVTDWLAGWLAGLASASSRTCLTFTVGEMKEEIESIFLPFYVAILWKWANIDDIFFSTRWNEGNRGSWIHFSDRCIYNSQSSIAENVSRKLGSGVFIRPIHFPRDFLSEGKKQGNKDNF